MHDQAGIVALLAAVIGGLLSALFYWNGSSIRKTIRRQSAGVHNFLVEKWQFDNLYDVMFVRPVHVVASWCTAFDKYVLDGLLHCSAD